jgi:hypothetical protein
MNNIDLVQTVVKELVEKRRSFTGRDVYERMYNRRVRRATLLNAPSSLGQREVSVIVRKLFNSGNDAFQRYGSCLTNGHNGPILYFPLPAHAKRKVEMITGALVPVQLVPLPVAQLMPLTLGGNDA